MYFIADSKHFEDNTLVEFLTFNASGDESGKQTTYAKAVNSLMTFLHGCGSALLPAPEQAICDWTVHMCVSGVSLKTALPYLNAIAGLYKKAVSEGLAPATDVFARVRSQLKENGDTLWKSWLNESDFKRLKDFIRARQNHTDVEKLIAFSLVKGCMPLAEAAGVKIDGISDADIELLAIDRSKFTGNRKYLFSLGRSGLTPAQFAQSVNNAVCELFGRLYISHSASADDTLRSYWAYAALHMSMTPHIVRCFFKDVPSGLPILSICKKEELSEESRRQIAGSVTEMFTANVAKWYVMRMRPRVRFDELEKKLDDLAEELPKPELFYPCKEIYRRTGKKISILQKPVIPDIVFFKYRETDICAMFLKIGDIAWGYKTDGRDGNKYAAVPRLAFERFQEAIGQFTPDYEVAPIGEIPLKEGDKVVIVGGEFSDCPAEIQKVEKPDALGRVIYRMSLLDTGFEWTVSEDSRLVKRKPAIPTAK